MSGSSGISQTRPDEMIDVLRPYFQDRNEPNFAWKSACSAFLALPALRAFWPMSSVDYANPQARDIAGGGYHLTNNNSADFGYDNLIPYVEFDGINQYLSRPDAGVANWADVTGGELYIPVTQRGLTFGGWWKADAFAGPMVLLGKAGAAAATISYFLDWNNAAGRPVRFYISDGLALDNVNLNTNAGAPSDWTFVVGRYDPSVEIKVWVNSTTNTNLVGIPAALNDSVTEFSVGAAAGGAGSFLDGKASLAFLCAAALSDAIIFSLYEQTRAMFNA